MMSFHLQMCFWECLSIGFLESGFICCTKVILKCQTSFGSCSCFMFFNIWKNFFFRLVFEVNLVFWGSGKFWFSETIGYGKNRALSQVKNQVLVWISPDLYMWLTDCLSGKRVQFFLSHLPRRIEYCCENFILVLKLESENLYSL